MEHEMIVDSTTLLMDAPLTPMTPRNNAGKTPTRGDRFIPTRSAMDLDLSHYALTKENANPNSPSKCTPSKEAYKEYLADQLFGGRMNKSSKVLAFKAKAPAPAEGHINAQRILYNSNKEAQPKKVSRHIAEHPFKILDAPQLLDDYYLNLVDWSRNNVLAIALGNKMYMFDAAAGTASQFMETDDSSNVITSVNWTKDGRHVAMGFNSGNVELWDGETSKILRRLKGHERRVGALSWNSHILSAGSRSGIIHNHDVRARNSLFQTLESHTQEVCGLKWSPDGLQLASGANDNVVNIWDVNTTTPKFSFTDHTAAVKGLAWCPWQKDLLASGGGAHDRTIKFWNTTTGALLNTIDTGSQVSQLVWSKNSGCREIVSSHGFARNQLCVWKYPSLVKVAELEGHSQRIISMAQSPDGQTVVSASADETLCFWNVFPDASELKTMKPKNVKVASPKIKAMNIR